MKKLKYLFLIIVVFLFIENVNAVEQYSGWGIDDLQVPYHVYGVNGKTEVPLEYEWRKEQEGTGLVTNLLPSIFSFLQTTKSYSLTSSNSTSLGFMVNYRFLANHDYVVKYDVCFNQEPNKDTNFFLGGKSDALNQTNSSDIFSFFTRSRSSLSNVPGYPDLHMTQSFNYQYCFQEQLIFTTNISANFLNIKFLRSSTASSWMALIDLDIRDTGLSQIYYDSKFSALNSAIAKISTDVQNSTQNTINNQNSNTQQQISNANSNQAQTNSNLNKINDSINDDNTSAAEDKATSFFEDFDSNDYGLSDIITIPLSKIQGLVGGECSVISVPIPFVNKNATLPCMNTIYSNYFGGIFNLYQTITTGIIAYYVCVNIYALVKGFKDPQEDKIEVMEL